MDKEQARFILQSFRPDGADARNPDFAEALAAAAEDRELSAWLAGERAQDAAFAAALARIPLPEGLRETILSVLQGESVVPEDRNLDGLMVRSLAAIQPPPGLREQILNAMEAERGDGTDLRKAPRRVWGWLNSAAVAAAVVLGAFVALEVTRRGGEGDSGGRLTHLSKRTIERSAIRLVSSDFKLDFKEKRPEALVSYLDGRHVPVPPVEDLPPELAGAVPVGCKVLQIGRKTASMICFDKKGLGVVHLVVVRREDLDEMLPDLDKAGEDCWQCPKSAVSVASWQKGERAYFLLGKVPPEKLREILHS